MRSLMNLLMLYLLPYYFTKKYIVVCFHCSNPENIESIIVLQILYIKQLRVVILMPWYESSFIISYMLLTLLDCNQLLPFLPFPSEKLVFHQFLQERRDILVELEVPADDVANETVPLRISKSC